MPEVLAHNVAPTMWRPLYEYPLRREWSKEGKDTLFRLSQAISDLLGHAFMPTSQQGRGINLLHQHEFEHLTDKSTKLGAIALKGDSHLSNTLRALLPPSTQAKTALTLNNVVIARPRQGTCNIIVNLRGLGIIAEERSQLTMAIDQYQGHYYQWLTYDPSIRIGYIRNADLEKVNQLAKHRLRSQAYNMRVILDPIR